MLSRCELERVADVLSRELTGGYVDRIVQRDEVRLELLVATGKRDDGVRLRFVLVISADPQYARIGSSSTAEHAPKTPLGFAQLLRAHIPRARILGVTLAPRERQVTLALSAAEGAFPLVLQLLGPRTNLYLLDAAGTILGALRPLAATRRTLSVGSPLTLPDSEPPPAGDDRFAAIPDAELLAAIELHYGALERERGTDLLARRLHRALERERLRLVRREGALRRDLAKLRPADEQRRLGELLKTGLHRVRPGMEFVRVPDYETGLEVDIPIEPRLTPAKNLEKLFAAYQRARRREVAAAEQGLALEAQLASLAALRGRFDAIVASTTSDPEVLRRLAADPEVARLLQRHKMPGEGPRPRVAKPARRGDGPPLRLRPGRYRTSDGLEVWVGRSAEGNDHLTTRLARGNDLFLHVEASPGSHVVLRLAGRKEAPPESLLEAAELAVHFSKQKHASRATLHVAPIHDVHKPKGAKPGLVHVQRGRSLALRRDPGRLARVLDARIEEPD